MDHYDEAISQICKAFLSVHVHVCVELLIRTTTTSVSVTTN